MTSTCRFLLIYNIGEDVHIVHEEEFTGKCLVCSQPQLRKNFAPAADRNKEPILEALRGRLGPSGDGQKQLRLLEISSGTGQHIAHLAPHFPHITFQPSEFDRHSLNSIRAHVLDCGSQNALPPIFLDVRADPETWGESGGYKDRSLDYILNINMLHISGADCTSGLFRNAGRLLNDTGLLITYGPFAFSGVIKPESNVLFDASLRGKDPEWGLRDVRNLRKLAGMNGLELAETIAMPANNHILIWRKIQ